MKAFIFIKNLYNIIILSTTSKPKNAVVTMHCAHY